MGITLESLPVELIADILAELDVESLVTASHLSRRIREITTDISLNPWRQPILRNIRNKDYTHPCLRSLSVVVIPPQTWIDILSRADSTFLLFDCSIPYLKADIWKEAFQRRFLPSWVSWKRDQSWRSVFLKILHRVWHRSQSFCTSDEAWTKYIVLNKNGSANALDISSRNMNPLLLFEEMKLQNNLAHLPTRVRLVVQLADVRVLAFGTLNKPKGTFNVNRNARDFLHPPRLEPSDGGARLSMTDALPFANRRFSQSTSYSYYSQESVDDTVYHTMVHPQAAPSHENYPFYTLGEGDRRWVVPDDFGELMWVGSMMIIAQIVGPRTLERDPAEEPPSLQLQDMDLVVGPGRSQYASFTWADLWAIAPWIEDRIAKRIDGPGLGN